MTIFRHLVFDMVRPMNDDANYRDLVAETYDIWFSGETFEDTEFFRRVMNELPGPALEVGCGTGRLLIPYLQDGLEVEGVDSSADMLAICRRKAEQLGLSPILHRQYMQELDLSRQYQTIYVPFGSFMLVSERMGAIETLKRFHAHLAPGGQVLLTTYLFWGETRFIPKGDLPAQRQKVWTLRRTGTRPSDGATILLHQAGVMDYVEQVQQGWYRYEVYLNGRQVDTYLQPMKLRWYSKYELYLMLEKAGFRDISVCGDYTESEASELHSVFVYRAWR